MFLPIFFVCLTSGQCDFLPMTPVSTERECMQALVAVERVLEQDVQVNRYMPACIKLEVA